MQEEQLSHVAHLIMQTFSGLTIVIFSYIYIKLKAVAFSFYTYLVTIFLVSGSVFGLLSNDYWTVAVATILLMMGNAIAMIQLTLKYRSRNKIIKDEGRCQR